MRHAALPLMATHFDLSNSMQGVVVSTLLVGAVIGSLAAGWPSDNLGRRATIVLSGLLFIAGCVLSSYAATSVAVLIVGRFVIGFAIGVTSATSPMFIAEMSPVEIRGGLVMGYQLSITAGILLALGIGHALTPARNWELIIFLAIPFAALQIIGMLFVPESPRFLLRAGKRDAALSVLIRIRGSEAAALAELAEIEEIREAEGKVHWNTVLGPSYRGPLRAGCGLAAISALCGINAIFYYSTKIFAIAGQGDPTLSSLALGVTNFGASFISLYIVNTFPRRKLLFIGNAGQIAGLVLAGAPLLTGSEVTPTAGWIMVAGILLFICFFAFSSGPLTWVVISEVFPLAARGKGAGIATSVNWFSNFIVALVYPMALGGTKTAREQQKRVGWSFIAFGVVCVLSIIYINAFVPETHGKSLEEIEQDFERHRLLKASKKSGEDEPAGTPLEAPHKNVLDI